MWQVFTTLMTDVDPQYVSWTKEMRNIDENCQYPVPKWISTKAVKEVEEELRTSRIMTPEGSRTLGQMARATRAPAPSSEQPSPGQPH